MNKKEESDTEPNANPGETRHDGVLKTATLAVPVIDHESDYKARYPKKCLNENMTDPRKVIANAIRMRRIYGENGLDTLKVGKQTVRNVQWQKNAARECGCSITLEYELAVPLSVMKPASPKFRQIFNEENVMHQKIVLENL